MLSWSCGKDTCFALHLARQRGFRVRALLNLIHGATGLTAFHCVKNEVAMLQAKALELPILQVDVSGDFRKQLKSALLKVRQEGIEVLGMGYFEPTEQRHFVHALADEVGLKVYEPLCGCEQRLTLVEMMDVGFEMIITSIDLSRISKNWLGKHVDAGFLQFLDGKGGISHCGEMGEFHTFVLDGPGFKKRLEVVQSSVVESDGYAHLYIDTARLRPKRSRSMGKR